MMRHQSPGKHERKAKLSFEREKKRPTRSRVEESGAGRGDEKGSIFSNVGLSS